MTDQPTDATDQSTKRPSNQQTDIGAHREVTLPCSHRSASYIVCTVKILSTATTDLKMWRHAAAAVRSLEKKGVAERDALSKNMHTTIGLKGRKIRSD